MTFADRSSNTPGAGHGVAPLVDRLVDAVVAADVDDWARRSAPERRRRLQDEARRQAPLLTDSAVSTAVADALARLGGLGPLEPLLADPRVTEVMVNGDGAVWIERAGGLERTDLVLAGDLVRHLAERVIAPLGLRLDRSRPIADARLPDGSRVNAVIPPVAVDGPCLTIRRFGVTAVPLERFASPAVVRLVAEAVRDRANIVVSGGTGAGKTTLLNALAAHVPAGERVITIEDTAELRLAAPHVVRLEARPANADGAGALPIRDLVRNALRMRPDRLIVGEVRGGEALDMLQAMNTGHEGSLSTCHANGPVDALRRLETLALHAAVDLPHRAVREQVHASVDLVVQVARGVGGVRRIVAVDEVATDPGAEAPTVPLVRAGRVIGAPSRRRVAPSPLEDGPVVAVAP